MIPYALVISVDDRGPSEGRDHPWQTVDSGGVPRGAVQTYRPSRHLSAAFATRDSSVRGKAHLDKPRAVRWYPQVPRRVRTTYISLALIFLLPFFFSFFPSRDLQSSLFLLITGGCWKPWSSTKAFSCPVLSPWRQWVRVKFAGCSSKFWPSGNGLENSSECRTKLADPLPRSKPLTMNINTVDFPGTPFISSQITNVTNPIYLSNCAVHVRLETNAYKHRYRSRIYPLSFVRCVVGGILSWNKASSSWNWDLKSLKALRLKFWSDLLDQPLIWMNEHLLILNASLERTCISLGNTLDGTND